MSPVNGAPVHTGATDTDAPVDTGDTEGRCRACPHPWSDHDTRDRRFCSATLALSHSRGCICGPPVRR